MAHNIAIINGERAMAFQGATPWHKLGTRMDSTADVDVALDAANLRWRVDVKTMYTGDPTQPESLRPVTLKKAIIRDVDGADLGVVGNLYGPLQNEDAFGILKPACEQFGVTIESAGALGRGERCWMLAKLKEGIEPVPGDAIGGYFLVMNGHDGSLALHAKMTPIRVVCQNTLNAALKDGNSEGFIKIRHTTSIGDRMKIAEEMVTRLVGALTETGDTFADLAAHAMSAEDVSNYIEDVFPAKGTPSDQLEARRETVFDLVWNGKGSQLAGADRAGNTATAWAAYNAVVEYLDHVRPTESKKAAAQMRAAESALFGSGAVIKANALVAARELLAV